MQELLTLALFVELLIVKYLKEVLVGQREVIEENLDSVRVQRKKSERKHLTSFTMKFQILRMFLSA